MNKMILQVTPFKSNSSWVFSKFLASPQMATLRLTWVKSNDTIPPCLTPTDEGWQAPKQFWLDVVLLLMLLCARGSVIQTLGYGWRHGVIALQSVWVRRTHSSSQRIKKKGLLVLLYVYMCCTTVCVGVVTPLHRCCLLAYFALFASIKLSRHRQRCVVALNKQYGILFIISVSQTAVSFEVIWIEFTETIPHSYLRI